MNLSGNIAKNNDGHITGTAQTPFIVDTTYSNSDLVRIGFYQNGVARGYLGIMNGKPTFTDASYGHNTLHHDGNSAKVAISEARPDDTTGNVLHVW